MDHFSKGVDSETGKVTISPIVTVGASRQELMGTVVLIDQQLSFYLISAKSASPLQVLTHLTSA